MSNEAVKVFAVPELLEAILLELTPLDLLLAQRVDKTFRDSINSSVRIQQKLFFQSNPKNPDDGTSAVNPFLGRIIFLADEAWHLHVVQEIEVDLREDFPPATMREVGDFERYVGCATEAPHILKPDEHILARKLQDVRRWEVDTYNESRHSWQKMLFTDPPKRFTVHDHVSLPNREETIAPVSMEDVMEALNEDLIEDGSDDDEDEDAEEEEEVGSDDDSEEGDESDSA